MISLDLMKSSEVIKAGDRSIHDVVVVGDENLHYTYTPKPRFSKQGCQAPFVY